MLDRVGMGSRQGRARIYFYRVLACWWWLLLLCLMLHVYLPAGVDIQAGKLFHLFIERRWTSYRVCLLLQYWRNLTEANWSKGTPQSKRSNNRSDTNAEIGLAIWSNWSDQWAERSCAQDFDIFGLEVIFIASKNIAKWLFSATKRQWREKMMILARWIWPIKSRGRKLTRAKQLVAEISEMRAKIFHFYFVKFNSSLRRHLLVNKMPIQLSRRGIWIGENCLKNAPCLSVFVSVSVPLSR